MDNDPNTGYVENGKQYQKAYYQKHREKKIAYARAQDREKVNARRRELARLKGVKEANRVLESGLSKDTALYNKRYHLEVRAEKLLKIKIKTLQIVSKLKKPVCCVCGASDIRCLVINHINGGGRKEHKLLSAAGFRISIIDGSRKTDDLDVRCQNCNIIYEYERGRARLPSNWEDVYREAVQ